MQYKILIVEDDEIITRELVNTLNSWNFNAKGISDFKNVLNEFIDFEADLVLMDIKLPYFNGYKWCEDIRKISKTPIIFISSINDNMNIVMAINMGADDFIAKPFDSSVLVAKINALLRRTYDYKTDNNILEYKNIIININDSSLSFEDNKLELTKNELRILTCLFEDKDKIVSREKLMQKLWETDVFVDDNTLTVNITRLRKKLEDIGINDLIKTRKGQGYSLV